MAAYICRVMHVGARGEDCGQSQHLPRPSHTCLGPGSTRPQSRRRWPNSARSAMKRRKPDQENKRLGHRDADAHRPTPAPDRHVAQVSCVSHFFCCQKHTLGFIYVNIFFYFPILLILFFYKFTNYLSIYKYQYTSVCKHTCMHVGINSKFLLACIRLKSFIY